MGLFDGMIGSALGGLLGGAAGNQAGGQQPNQLLQIALQLVQQNGGLPGLLEKFRQSGLGQHADSWVSTGANMPISPEQVSQALGPDVLSQIASRAGIDPAQLTHGLSQVLPGVVDQMTPGGVVPDNHQSVVLDGLAALLKGSLG
jgi:uncharacterized protein YidB (DUF937 family)